MREAINDSINYILDNIIYPIYNYFAYRKYFY